MNRDTGPRPFSDREALLRELSHRTKNSLQILSSLMRLRARNPETLELALETERRIDVISGIQDVLYESRDMNAIDLSEAARKAGEILADRFATASGTIRLRISTENVPVPVDTAMPCALALYELLANAYTHAFRVGQGGTIEIGVRGAREERAELWVMDDGRGLPPGFDSRRSSDGGFSILDCLVEQLGGALVLSPCRPGLRASISFERSRFMPGSEGLRPRTGLSGMDNTSGDRFMAKSVLNPEAE